MCCGRATGRTIVHTCARLTTPSDDCRHRSSSVLRCKGMGCGCARRLCAQFWAVLSVSDSVSSMVRETAGSRGGEPVALTLRAIFRSEAGDVLACWDRNNGMTRARAGDPWGRYWCWRGYGLAWRGCSDRCLTRGRFPVRGARPEGDLRARSGECPMLPRVVADDGTGTLGTVEWCPMAVR